MRGTIVTCLCTIFHGFFLLLLHVDASCHANEGSTPASRIVKETRASDQLPASVAGANVCNSRCALASDAALSTGESMSSEFLRRGKRGGEGKRGKRRGEGMGGKEWRGDGRRWEKRRAGLRIRERRMHASYQAVYPYPHSFLTAIVRRLSLKSLSSSFYLSFFSFSDDSFRDSFFSYQSSLRRHSLHHTSFCRLSFRTQCIHSPTCQSAICLSYIFDVMYSDPREMERGPPLDYLTNIVWLDAALLNKLV